ncbi:50S ribosomal protein L35, chloroplastic-like [Mangifera indica]|uniref:50S ribosomal protein L35, chloroplastic-like n=1 Tax=Mangifera indica TaxID=29780 RepID=UPI001CFC317E|nr:50S ribosomal protein L35, chloroplastic-like [Mangifera indica]
MASLSMLSCSLKFCHFSPIRPSRCSYSPLQLTSKLQNSLKLTFTHHISPSSSLLLRSNNLSESTLVAQTRPRTVTVFAAKGYKMKTHKASAKRFRVTGRGKIVRRRAGKQHLLAKKNTKRKLRLSKMHPVSRSDYDNVLGALPYLKVNRNAK